MIEYLSSDNEQNTNSSIGDVDHDGLYVGHVGRYGTTAKGTSLLFKKTLPVNLSQ